MKALKGSEPLFLLIAFGLAFGSIIAVSKVAMGLGAHPITLAFHQFIISGLMLLIACVFRRRTFSMDVQRAKYFVISGVLGIAGPHVLLFLVVQELGAGLTSMAYIFPPLFTYFLALVIRMERFDGYRALGLLVGFVGSFVIVMAVLSETSSRQDSTNWFWLGVLYLIPLSLSWGNIYRSKRWPENLNDLQITMATLMASAVLLLVPAVLGNWQGAFLIQATAVNAVTVGQAILTCAAYLIFFRLQRVGGAVYLSQSGFIITGIGLVYGFVLFGERYSMGMWAGFAVSLCGVLIVTVRQSLRRPHLAKPTEST